jgi:hypothetical protein
MIGIDLIERFVSTHDFSSFFLALSGFDRSWCGEEKTSFGGCLRVIDVGNTQPVGNPKRKV